ncbi:hypothetical protein E2C01_052306 [Portunus trituberculatus]|uniref:Uncharacterized protein n=1 Tax=Portunus trituberculatus TaxID=210409 RepID=A0A5B7GMM8_PORTR|nr:hypothetical protein [Portunus trituberculatus]
MFALFPHVHIYVFIAYFVYFHSPADKFKSDVILFLFSHSVISCLSRLTYLHTLSLSLYLIYTHNIDFSYLHLKHVSLLLIHTLSLSLHLPSIYNLVLSTSQTQFRSFYFINTPYLGLFKSQGSAHSPSSNFALFFHLFHSPVSASSPLSNPLVLPWHSNFIPLTLSFLLRVAPALNSCRKVSLPSVDWSGQSQRTCAALNGENEPFRRKPFTQVHRAREEHQG